MFHPAPAPSQDEIESLVGRASKRILRFLQRCKIITLVTAPGHGEVTVVGDETMDEKDPLLANLLAAATAGAAPAGRANQRQPLRVVLDPDDRPVGKGTLCPQTQGFNLHAATKVAANNKPGRPTPCRYVLRPPLASRVGSRPALLEPIVVERWSAISASAAASCPKCSIFRAELQRADRAQRGRETAEVHDRFHLPQQVGSHRGPAAEPGVPRPLPRRPRRPARRARRALPGRHLVALPLRRPEVRRARGHRAAELSDGSPPQLHRGASPGGRRARSTET
jgi:hypothetical protein